MSEEEFDFRYEDKIKAMVTHDHEGSQPESVLEDIAYLYWENLKSDIKDRETAAVRNFGEKVKTEILDRPHQGRCSLHDKYTPACAKCWKNKFVIEYAEACEVDLNELLKEEIDEKIPFPNSKLV